MLLNSAPPRPRSRTGTKSDPAAAMITLKAKGSIENEGIACKVETGRAGGRGPASGHRRLRA